jgi:hypothetical protein
MSDDAFTEMQHAAIKDILLGWSDLSRGDISIICANWRTPGQIETMDGTPHARFWRSMVQIGWAEQLYSLIDPETVPFDPVSFRLTDEGHAYLPRFLLFYDLLNMGACTPAKDQEHFQWVLAQREKEQRNKPWIPDPRRLVFALIAILSGLWLAYRGANLYLCFFLVTYSGTVALLMHADIFKGTFGKMLRGVAGVNAVFLSITVIPLLFH